MAKWSWQSEDRATEQRCAKQTSKLHTLHLHVAMNFHAYHTDEMATPAATTEVQAIRQRQQDHLVKLSLREVDSTSVMLYPQLGLTPRKSTKKTANSHTTTQLSNSHEKRVKTELSDVMNRASDDMKGVIQGQSGLMLTAGFLTPLQEKLRAAQESKTHPHSSNGNRHSNRRRFHAMESSPAGSPMRQTWQPSPERRLMSNSNRKKKPKEYIDPWSQKYVDTFEVGGPTALQLATHENKQLERQLAKVLHLSASLHADTTTNMRMLCGRCENHAKWLTHGDRARMYVFDDYSNGSNGSNGTGSPLGEDDESRRMVYFRSKGTPEYVQLGTLMTTPSSTTGVRAAASSTAIAPAFLGLVPNKGQLQPRLQLAVANVVTTGRSTAVPPAPRHTHTHIKGTSLHRTPPATASWCFPVTDEEDTNVLALLVVVGAKNPMTVVPSSVNIHESSDSDADSDVDASMDTKQEAETKNNDHTKQHEEFDEDKYSVCESSLFREFLSNVGIALRNCIKRNQEVNGLTGKSEEERLMLQKQLDKAIITLKKEKHQFEMEKKDFQTQLINEKNDFQTQLSNETKHFEKEQELYKIQLEKEEHQFLAREKELELQNRKQQEDYYAKLEIEQAKREVEKKQDEEKLQQQQKQIEELNKNHEALEDKEKEESKKLMVQKKLLDEAKMELSRQQERNQMEMKKEESLEHEMEAEKELEQELKHQVAQLESEVKHQKSRAVNAKKIADRSKKKLPLAMEQLRRLSVTAFSEQSKDNDSSEDVAELLCAIVDSTVNILDAERVTLFMVGDDGTKLVGTAFANFHDMNRLNPATKNLKIVIDRTIGICGHVASTRQLFNIRDVYDDPRFDRSVDMRTGYRTKSMLVCPILSAKGETLGVLQTMNKRTINNDDATTSVNAHEKGQDRDTTQEWTLEEGEGAEDYFTQDDEQVIQMFSQHAAMAIEHSRGIRSEHHDLELAKQQLEHIQKELNRHDNDSAMLLDAAQDIAVQLDFTQLDGAISHGNGDNVLDVSKLGDFLAPMFSKVVAHARRLCHADRGSLFFCDYAGRRLWSAIAEGVTTTSSSGEGGKNSHRGNSFVIELPMGKGVVGRVAETGKSLMTVNARSLPFFDDSHDLKSGYRTMSILCVPIIVGDVVVAVLMLINKLKAETDPNCLPVLSSRNGPSTPPRSSSSPDRRRRSSLSPTPEAGADACFDEHDLDLAERLAAQVSGPVAHAQEMILVAQKHTGEGEIQLHTLQSKMKELEQKANAALQHTEDELRGKVVDERTKAAKMMSVLSFGAVRVEQNKQNVGQLLSSVLDQVRDVMHAQAVTLHMKDADRNVLWPRSSSGRLSMGGVGTTSLTTGGGGNKANSAVAKTIAFSSSGTGLETCRRACAMSGELSGQTLGTTGMDIMCIPVNGRDEKGTPIVLGVLESVFPTNDDLVGAEKREKAFLQAVSTQIGAILTEEYQAKTRAAGKEKAANELVALHEQIEDIKKEEETKVHRVGKQLKRERRLSMAANTLASNTKYRQGKHGLMVDLFSRTVKAATGLVFADRGSLFLVEPEKGMLQTTVMNGDNKVKLIEVPIKSNSIAGSCAITGDLTNVPDAYRDARFNRSVDKKLGYRTRSMLTLPVHAVIDNEFGTEVKDDDAPPQVIAVLQLINKQDGTDEKKIIPFDDNDVELLKRFVIQIAPAIRDALQQDSLAHEVASSHEHLREIETKLVQEKELAAKHQEQFDLAQKKIVDQAKEEADKANQVMAVISKKNVSQDTTIRQLNLDKERLMVGEKSLQAKVLLLQKQLASKDELHNRAKRGHEEQLAHAQRINKSDCEALQTKITRKEEHIVDLTRRLQESEEREEETRSTNRRLQEEVAIVNANVAAAEVSAAVAAAQNTTSPSIRRNQITRLGKSGMRKLMEGDDVVSDGTSEDWYDDDVLTSKGRGRKNKGQVSSASRVKNRKKKKNKNTSNSNRSSRSSMSSNDSKSSRGSRGMGKEKGVVLRFGPDSLQKRKMSKRTLSKTKMSKTKKKKKKKVAGRATLSAEGGGPVTVVIDRSLFTGRPSARSPAKRSNRYFTSPRRASPARRSMMDSPGRLTYGFAVPNTARSFTPGTPTDFVFK